MYIFEKIYLKVLPFQFDAYKSYGTGTARWGMNFTREQLAKSSFTFDAVQTMLIQQRNRAKNLTGLKKHVETFLNTKEVEWLLEHFKGMSPAAQKEFIKAVQDMLDNRK